MAALGVFMAAGMITAPSASAADTHNVMLTGANFPGGVHSVLIWKKIRADGVYERVGCVKNIQGRRDVNTGIYVKEGERYAFWGQSGTSCKEAWGGVVGVEDRLVPYNLATQNYWVDLGRPNR
ncbi:hypothetical protein ACFYZ8_01330 [Streptomyces sp. NPDC001668]|uniref:hypothetical protein n=1 Tax=unclassified Streptomyces TaxID=2593676 RepID=UPI0033E965F8